MINQQLLERIQDRITTHNRKKNGPLSFTVEYGRGETYSNQNITIYAHDKYERSSVLAGRERRMHIGSFGQGHTEQDARDTIEAAGAGKITDFLLEGGTTYIPVNQIVSHLPDDTDY